MVRKGLVGALGAVALLWAGAGLVRVTGPSGAPAAPQLQSVPVRLALKADAKAEGPAVRSLLNVRKQMRYGQFLWDEQGVPAGPVWVRVDLERQVISVFRAGHEIGTAVILYGQDGNPTPPGHYPIIEKRAQHRSNLYDAEMPYMIRLTNDGIAIHASDVRRGSATHGCIGVPLEFAKRLFDAVAAGDDVMVVA